VLDQETEIKLRVASARAARARVRRLGARLVKPRHFEDNTLYDDAAGTLRGQGCVLRLRRVDGAGLLTYKGPGSVALAVKSRREVETVVEDPDALHRILAAIGFLPRFRYQKYRAVYRHRQVEIVIDETPIGVFLEIEGAPQAIHETAAALGFARRDYVLESYVALFFASGGRGDMLFPKQPRA